MDTSVEKRRAVERASTDNNRVCYGHLCSSCERIEDEKVFGILEEKLGDFEDFKMQILRFLKEKS